MFLSANKSGDFCVQAINKSNDMVESILNSPDKDTFRAQFAGADKLTVN